MPLFCFTQPLNLPLDEQPPAAAGADRSWPTPLSGVVAPSLQLQAAFQIDMSFPSLGQALAAAGGAARFTQSHEFDSYSYEDDAFMHKSR